MDACQAACTLRPLSASDFRDRGRPAQHQMGLSYQELTKGWSVLLTARINTRKVGGEMARHQQPLSWAHMIPAQSN